MTETQEAEFSITFTETQINTLKGAIFNCTFSGRDLNNINSLVAAINAGLQGNNAAGTIPQPMESIPEQEATEE